MPLPQPQPQPSWRGRYSHGIPVLKTNRIPVRVARSLLTTTESPTEPLFSIRDGLAWNKDNWHKPVKQAAARAGLPAGTSAYTLRHCAITDLVHGGFDLLTVAQLRGTSVAMIEKHYGHLRSEVAVKALARLAL